MVVKSFHGIYVKYNIPPITVIIIHRNIGAYNNYANRNISDIPTPIQGKRHIGISKAV